MSLTDPIWSVADTMADTGVGRSYIRNRINSLVDSDKTPSVSPDTAEQILKHDKLRKVLFEESNTWLDNPANKQRLLAAFQRLKARTPVEKQAALQDMTEYYQKNVGSNPLLDTAALSAGAGLVSYLASGPIIKAVTSAAGLGSPDIQRAAQQYFADPDNLAKTKRRLAILAAAAGAAYGVYKHSDWTGGMPGFKQSMTDPKYWEKNPDRREAYTAKAPLTEQSAVSMDKVSSMLPLSIERAGMFDTADHGKLFNFFFRPGYPSATSKAQKMQELVAKGWGKRPKAVGEEANWLYAPDYFQEQAKMQGRFGAPKYGRKDGARSMSSTVAPVSMDKVSEQIQPIAFPSEAERQKYLKEQLRRLKLKAGSPVGIDKMAEQDPYYQDNIHVPTAISIVGRDPVLFPQNRARVASIVSQSANSGQRTSGFRITDTVLQSGVDFSAAYLFGQGLGRVLSLPSPVVDRVSAAGGVAAAVIGSGVLSKFGF